MNANKVDAQTSQLRFIDKPNQEDSSDKIEVELSTNGEIWKEKVSYFPSPVAPNFDESLKEHLTHFIREPLNDNDKSTHLLNRKLTRHGREMGEKLLGSDYCLYTILEKIEELGLEHCHISFESERLEFFKEPWEILIIPDSNQFLSTSCASFTRNHGPIKETQKEEGESNRSSLKILLVSSQVDFLEGMDRPFASGRLIHKLMEFGKSVAVQTLYSNSWKKLIEKLSDEDEKPDIIHFEGVGKSFVKPEGQREDYLCFEENGEANLISLKEISELLKKHEIPLFTLDIEEVETSISQGPGRESLGQRIAFEISKQGATTVVLANQPSYAFSSTRLFQLFYSCLFSGLTISAAAIETRKGLQLQSQQDEYSLFPVGLFDWPQIAHYGSGEVQFFKEPQSPLPLHESPPYQKIKGILAGFNHELTLPDTFFGRNDEIQLMRQLWMKGEAFGIRGNSGLGKTHLINQFATLCAIEGSIENAFYFDFRYMNYDRELVLKMIGEFWEKENATPENTLKRLKERPILIIFDNFDEVQEKKLFSDLQDLINELNPSASKILISQRKETIEPLKDYYFISLRKLTFSELRQVAVKSLKRDFISKKEEEQPQKEPSFSALLSNCQGNPYYLDRLLSFIEKEPDNKIGEEFTAQWDRLKELEYDDPVEALFEFGWKRIKPEYQSIYASLASLENFISEGLPVSMSMKRDDGKSPGEELFELLGIEITDLLQDFSEVGTQAGFLVQKYDVKEFHPFASNFLKKKREFFPWWKNHHEEIEIALSKLYVGELQMLDSYLEKNQNSALQAKISENHRRWLDALERLLREKHYLYYLQGGGILTKLLKPLGLENQFNLWSWKVLQSFPLPNTGELILPEEAHTWFQTAHAALQVEAASDSPILKKGEAFWISYIKESQNDGDRSVRQNALMFLETFYRKKNDWSGRLALSRIALEKAEQQKKYEEMITALLSISRCEQALGDMEACKKNEYRLLNEIPYDSLDEGALNNVIIALANSSIVRKDYENANTLLDRLDRSVQNKEPDESEVKSIEEISVISDLLRGRIFLQQEKFEKAAPLIIKQWKGIAKREHMVQPNMVMDLLKELVEKMERETFERVFKEHAPDLPLPPGIDQSLNPNNPLPQ